MLDNDVLRFSRRRPAVLKTLSLAAQDADSLLSTVSDEPLSRVSVELTGYPAKTEPYRHIWPCRIEYYWEFLRAWKCHFPIPTGFSPLSNNSLIAFLVLMHTSIAVYIEGLMRWPCYANTASLYRATENVRYSLQKNAHRFIVSLHTNEPNGAVVGFWKVVRPADKGFCLISPPFPSPPSLPSPPFPSL